MRNCIQIQPLTVMAENIIYSFFQPSYDSTYHLLLAFPFKLKLKSTYKYRLIFSFKKVVNSVTTDHYFEAEAIY